jgi:hypothetical protein
VAAWRLLREMCGDDVELRKGDHSAERLKIERERLEFERERSDKRVLEKVEAVLQEPETKQRLCGGCVTDAERVRRMREIFGLPTEEKPQDGISPETLAKIERAANLL